LGLAAREAAVRIGKAGKPKPMMHGHEKSDPAIVAGKSTNNDRHLSAASMAPRAGAKGNAIERGMRRTPSRERLSHALDRVRQAAKEQSGERFTALLHHVDVDLLGSVYDWLRKAASAGVDGVTWAAYGEGLERKLVGLQTVSTGVPTGRNRHGGCIYPSRTDERVHWA
jgi:hypothetical protein